MNTTTHRQMFSRGPCSARAERAPRQTDPMNRSLAAPHKTLDRACTGQGACVSESRRIPWPIKNQNTSWARSDTLLKEYTVQNGNYRYASCSAWARQTPTDSGGRKSWGCTSHWTSRRMLKVWGLLRAFAHGSGARDGVGDRQRPASRPPLPARPLACWVDIETSD